MRSIIFRVLLALAVLPITLAPGLAAPATAQTAPGGVAATGAPQPGTTPLQSTFDTVLGTDVREPQSFEAVYETSFERRIAALADGSQGRIGVAALDLATGRQIAVLGDQRFPMASTSKVAIGALFLEGVEKKRWTLDSEFPLLIPVGSAKYAGSKAPVRNGQALPARKLLELMITRSSNTATDALLNAVGGPDTVTAWARRNGVRDFTLSRDIATLVRDDGEFDPANHIDLRDSASPQAMIDILAGLYNHKFLSARNSELLLDVMSRTRTGTRRIPALIPASAEIRHKTGSLHNTCSDIGIVRLPDGRDVALAVYVTGQGTRLAREAKIAEIARALYDGYAAQAPERHWTGAEYPGG